MLGRDENADQCRHMATQPPDSPCSVKSQRGGPVFEVGFSREVMRGKVLEGCNGSAYTDGTHLRIMAKWVGEEVPGLRRDPIYPCLETLHGLSSPNGFYRAREREFRILRRSIPVPPGGPRNHASRDCSRQHFGSFPRDLGEDAGRG